MKIICYAMKMKFVHYFIQGTIDSFRLIIERHFENLADISLLVLIFIDVAKTEKTEGPVIHHLNHDQKALVIRYEKIDTGISLSSVSI